MPTPSLLQRLKERKLVQWALGLRSSGLHVESPPLRQDTVMKLSLKGLAFSFGIVWGGCVFLVGLGNLVWPDYGAALLDVARSIYPGYAKTSGLWGVIVGTLYALVDGAILGLIFGWLYNRLRGEDPGPAVIL